MPDDLRDQLQRALGATYALDRELGGGGMSRVFIGEETSLARKVVVKVLPSELAASVNVERFRREIQLAARLQHPHIVPVLAAGISDGLPYYTMPLIEGESLRARLTRSGELPVPDVARVLRDVLGALAYAHQHGVVHRDIKPDNVLLTGNHAMVTDFGVAKALSASTSPGSSLTSLGVALGTPAYMSPEQAAADPATDHRADLYAVGAMAYEMLTGQQVFSARSPQAMLAAHAVETPEPIDKRRPAVPPALALLVMRALEKHAADRPQSADEMLAELAAAVTPSGATTPHVGAERPRSAPRSGRRRSALAAAAALVVLAVALSTWYLRRSAAGAGVAASAPDSIPSLAVLPFENLGSAGDAYFADGMTEEISSRLGTLSGLRVIGRQSAKSYAGTAKPVAQIGKELDVAYLLTGTVRWDRSRAGRELVRVSPALLRASDGAQLWAEPYQDEVTGVFEIQGKVAERVAQALRLRLTERQQKTLVSAPTTNLKAYDYFLRGMALEAGSWDPKEWARVIADYEQAVTLDPGFATAHAALARAHLGLYWFRGDPSPRRLELAKAAADRALALAPNLPAAHLALADYYYHGKLDYPRALEQIETAQRTTPNDPEALRLKALILRRQNRWDEAIANEQRGSGLDPRNMAMLGDLCETLVLTHRYDDLQEPCGRFNLLAPDKPNGHDFLARVAILRSGDVNAALLILEKARQQIGDQALVAGLTSPESRTVWPAMLQPDLARRMISLAVPAAGPQRTGYLTSKLALSFYLKDSTAMRQYADSILLAVPAALRGNFFDSELYAARSLAYAAKGDRAKALGEGRRAMQTLPLERDALRGAANLVLVTRAAVLAGAHDEAVSMLRQLMTIPNELSPAWLGVDPWFEPLRRDPEFLRLVADRR